MQVHSTTGTAVVMAWTLATRDLSVSGRTFAVPSTTRSNTAALLTFSAAPDGRSSTTIRSRYKHFFLKISLSLKAHTERRNWTELKWAELAWFSFWRTDKWANSNTPFTRSNRHRADIEQASSKHRGGSSS